MGIFNGVVDNDAKLPDFEPFPAGKYELEIIEGEVKATKDGEGKLFTHRIKVIEGDHEGRLIFGNINLVNKNELAHRMGQGEFKVLRAVTGTSDIPDSQLDPEDLFFKRFTGVVKITPAKGDFEARNSVNWAATYKLFTQGEQPDGKPAIGKPANDNVKAANDNVTPAAATGSRPWSPRAAA